MSLRARLTRALARAAPREMPADPHARHRLADLIARTAREAEAGDPIAAQRLEDVREHLNRGIAAREAQP